VHGPGMSSMWALAVAALAIAEFQHAGTGNGMVGRWPVVGDLEGGPADDGQVIRQRGRRMLNAQGWKMTLVHRPVTTHHHRVPGHRPTGTNERPDVDVRDGLVTVTTRSAADRQKVGHRRAFPVLPTTGSVVTWTGTGSGSTVCAPPLMGCRPGGGP